MFGGIFLKKAFLLSGLIIISLFCSNDSNARELKQINGSLVDWLSENEGSLIKILRESYGEGTESYIPLKNCNLEKEMFKRLISRLLDGVLDDNAFDLLKQLNNAEKNISRSFYNYEIVVFNDTDSGEKYYVLMEPINDVALRNSGQGIYIINPTGNFSVTMSAPHAQFESNTAYYSAKIFSELNLKAFALSVTDRCSNHKESNTYGKTSVCGGYYRNSDLSHNVCTFFQAFHEEINERNRRSHSKSTVIQLHGAGKGIDKNTGKYIHESEFYFSDGTEQIISEPYNVKNSNVIKLAQLVADRVMNQDIIDESKSVITSCQAGENEIDGVVRSRKLCGTSNVQGRLLNQTKSNCNTCSENVYSTSNSFIHIELRKDIREGYLLENRLNVLINSIKDVLL